jgi:hypothetical protein
VDGIIEEKLQLVMRRIDSLILLSLLFIFFLPARGYSQCPEKVVIENQGPGNDNVQELFVYDSFDTGVDITDFEVNIFNEESGNYLVIESANFPSIGITNDIQMIKEGNRIQLVNFPDNADLLRCVVIFIGEECPVDKITVSTR